MVSLIYLKEKKSYKEQNKRKFQKRHIHILPVILKKNNMRNNNYNRNRVRLNLRHICIKMVDFIKNRRNYREIFIKI